MYPSAYFSPVHTCVSLLWSQCSPAASLMIFCHQSQSSSQSSSVTGVGLHVMASTELLTFGRAGKPASGVEICRLSISCLQQSSSQILLRSMVLNAFALGFKPAYCSSKYLVIISILQHGLHVFFCICCINNTSLQALAFQVV